MTTTPNPVDPAIYEMYRALPLERLRKELKSSEESMAKKAKRFPQHAEQHAAFMAPVLAILREVIAEKEN